MDVFEFRQRLIKDYADYLFSFVHIRNQRIRKLVDDARKSEIFWPEPLLQLNPRFETGKTIDDLVIEGILNSQCGSIFRVNKTGESGGVPMQLHKHQNHHEIPKSSDIYYLHYFSILHRICYYFHNNKV